MNEPEPGISKRGHDPRDVGVAPIEIVIMAVVSAGMLMATGLRWWSIGWTEVIGFVTGGICVWLTVRASVWNWPIGIANNVAFFVLFGHARLYADASLQIIYLGLGIYGWASWLFGGVNRTPRTITRATTGEMLVLACLTPLVTLGLMRVLTAINGAAPFWDALTTVLSIVAQILMCRKRLEHWYVWIIVDLIYIPLYLTRDLRLTAILYGVFLVMCVIGLHQWRARWSQHAERGHG